MLEGYPTTSRLVSILRSLHHRQEKRLRNLIRAPEPDLTEYEDAYKSNLPRLDKFQECSKKELFDEVTRSDFTFIADFITSTPSKRFITSLLKKVGNWCLLIGVGNCEQQNLVGKLLAREITFGNFWESVDSERNWPLSCRNEMQKWLELAAEKGNDVFLYQPQHSDSMSIARRDEESGLIISMAKEVAKQLPVIVVTGSWRAGRQGLPSVVRAFAPGARLTIIHQNLEDLYIKEVEQRDSCPLCLKVPKKSEFCVFTEPPILAMHTYIANLVHGDEFVEWENLWPTFSRCVATIAGKLGLELNCRQLSSWKVYPPGSTAFLRWLYQESGFSDEQLQGIEKQILDSQSRIFPEANIVYVGELSLLHVAEEASHLLRLLHSGPQHAVNLEEEFFLTALNEAAGYFGSKFLVPDRSPPQIAQLDDYGPETLAHLFGYRLGEQMFQAWTKKALCKEAAVKLFTAQITRGRSAKALYQQLNRAVEEFT